MANAALEITGFHLSCEPGINKDGKYEMNVKSNAGKPAVKQAAAQRKTTPFP